MLSEVLEHFGFTRDLHAAGYYETSYHRQFLKNLRSAIHSGNLIAFTGLVGSGKTLLLRQLQDELLAEKRITVAKSLAVDKDRASLTTLITALFYDLSPDKEPKIPSQSEHRERALRELVRKSKRPVVLFIDDAHDLHHKTLVGLKRLREVVADGGGVLSIVLAGHPKLRNVLLRPNMEEIGFRFAVFPFEGMAGYQADYIAWLLGRCLKENTDQAGIIEFERGRPACHAPAHAAADRTIPDLGVRGDVPYWREGGHSGGRRGGAVAADRRPRAAAHPLRV